MEEPYSKMEVIMSDSGRMIRNVDGVQLIKLIKRQVNIYKKMEFGMNMVN